jgi:endonuclease/exonuclease/phosphatase family metal-dependent hydrolase
MRMRLASYNVENLFSRAKAMSLDTWEQGKPVLEQFAALNALLGETAYTAAMRRKMVALMKDLGLEKSDTGPYVILRRNRGKLLRRPRDGGIEIIAQGRADWVGSLELRQAPIDERAMRNTARVMADIKADVLAVVEAENRPALASFNDEIVAAVGGKPYRHVMLIDGNDERGIDVGLLSGDTYPIGPMRSHVDDRSSDGQPVFSRDCPEYTIATPSGETLIVLVNHFKSKGYGGKEASDAKRRAQARRVSEIYKGLIAGGAKYVAVVGDLNDTPDSKPLQPLIHTQGLRDAFEHPSFDVGGYPGTYGLCNASNKIDYLLLSPQLYDKVRGGGVYRRGMWPGSRPVRWEVYEDLTKPDYAGSDHGAVWVDVDL